MRYFRFAILFAIVPLLTACTSTGDGVTCTITTTSIACGINQKALTQDLSATGVAKDEKPDRPLEQSASRLEATAP